MHSLPGQMKVTQLVKTFPALKETHACDWYNICLLYALNS